MKITAWVGIGVITVVFAVMAIVVLNDIKIGNEKNNQFVLALQKEIVVLQTNIMKLQRQGADFEERLKELNGFVGDLQYKTFDLENRFMGTIEVYQTDLHELHTKLDALHHLAPKRFTKRRCKCR